MPVNRSLMVVTLAICVAAAMAPQRARSAETNVNTTIVISGATLVDVTGRPAIEDSLILVRNGRIAAVARRGNIPISSQAKVLDARGKFVIPGLADMHNHLGDGTFELNQPRADARRNLERMLGWGFTLIHEHGLADLDVFAELKTVTAQDTSPYPRFFGAGVVFRAKEGHGVLRGSLTPESPEQAREQVRMLKAAHVDSVKIMHTDLRYVTTHLRPTIDPDIMAAIIDEAHKNGLKVYVHAPVLALAKQALRAGADGLAHGILSDAVDEEFLELMKANHATYITTHTIFEAVADIATWARREQAFDTLGLIPREVYEVGMNPTTVKRWEERWNNLTYTRQRLPVLRANTRKVWDAGILVVAGSDSGNSGAGTLLGIAAQIELSLLVEAGLTAQQALQAATLNAARMIGREAELGSIEPGKHADLVILDANPLDDIRNVYRIYRVMKGGVLYDPREKLSR